MTERKGMEEKIRESLEDNRRILESIFGDCADVTLRTVMMGTNVRGLAIFMEPTAGDLYGLSQMLLSFLGQSREEVQSRIRAGQLGLVDACTLDDFSQAVAGFFAGDVILFADGVAKAVKIPAKGYPGLGVVKADAEKGLRGSDESFSDSVKINASLIRKRIKSPKLKLKEYEVGERTKTRIYLLYIEDLVEKELLYRVEERMNRYSLDGITDSGVQQQLLSDSPEAIFPQLQSTRRPALTCEELLEGRGVLLVDNSPEALLLPAVYQNFFATADDRYLNFRVVSFLRGLRYCASVFAMFFPGAYILAASYETQLIPTSLFLTIQRAEADTPLSAPLEILLMEASFALLREAGVRMPGEMGNAVGIVGGLIIGSAAVEAGFVSPMAVVVVAFTALCTFCVPNEELAQAYRLINVGVLVLCAVLGPVGLFMGMLWVTLRLASLTSLGYPFWRKMNDTFVVPATMRRLRGLFARRQNPVRLRKKG
ncbi:MAG: spore germination protein [Lachnospiraceae bacterium]|nr:spore germination protein [Lachnospiraceae bacterium]